MKTSKSAPPPKRMSKADATAAWTKLPEHIRESIVQELERQGRAAFRDGYTDFSEGCTAVVAILTGS